MGPLDRVRFGVSVSGAPTAGAWVDRARRAESGGFDTLLIPESSDPAVLAPLPAIAMAATSTSTLRFGTLLASTDLRRPVALARESATIDLLTGGRFELGLGAGHRRTEYERAGLHVRRSSEEVSRLSEVLDIIRLLWTGEPVWFDGVHHQLHGHSCEVSMTAPSIRLVVAGNGWRLLDLAARKADTVGFVGVDRWGSDDRPAPSHFTTEGLAQQIEWVKGAAEGRFDQLELALVVHHAEITRHRRRVAERVRRSLPRLTVDEILDSPYVLAGSSGQLTESLHEVHDRFGISYLIFPESSWATAETLLGAL